MTITPLYCGMLRIGTKFKTFAEHTDWVKCVAFSPNGLILASASMDSSVKLWSVSSDSYLSTLKHSDWVESVVFSPNGKTLATSGNTDGSIECGMCLKNTLYVQILSMDTGVEYHPSHFHPTVSYSLRQVMTIQSDYGMSLADLKSNRSPNTAAMSIQLYFRPMARRSASSSRDNTIKLWKVSSGENFATFEIQNNLYVYAEAIAFSPDGKWLASACVDYTVKLWDVVNHREATTLMGHHGGVTSVAFSPDGRTLASGSRDRTVLLWDLSYFGFEMPPIADAPEVSEPPVVSENPPIADLSEEPKLVTDALEESDSPEVGEPELAVSESESKPHLQDTTPPDIVIDSPMERIVNSTVRQVPVKVNVTDDSRVAEVWVNGMEASVLEADVFSVTAPLNHGKNEIRTVATDAHGNMGTHRFTIVREEPDHIDLIPPEIVIHSPTSRSARVTTEQFTIEGSIIDDGGIAEVWINSVKAVVSEAGEFTATILIDFGENEIRITATDTQGNIDTNVLIVHREDTEGPEIQILSPEYSDRRGFQPIINSLAESVLVSGIVTDPSGVVAVKVNGIEAQVRGDRFEDNSLIG